MKIMALEVKNMHYRQGISVFTVSWVYRPYTARGFSPD